MHVLWRSGPFDWWAESWCRQRAAMKCVDPTSSRPLGDQFSACSTWKSMRLTSHLYTLTRVEAGGRRAFRGLKRHPPTRDSNALCCGLSHSQHAQLLPTPHQHVARAWTPLQIKYDCRISPSPATGPLRLAAHPPSQRRLLLPHRPQDGCAGPGPPRRLREDGEQACRLRRIAGACGPDHCNGAHQRPGTH